MVSVRINAAERSFLVGGIHRSYSVPQQLREQPLPCTPEPIESHLGSNHIPRHRSAFSARRGRAKVYSLLLFEPWYGKGMMVLSQCTDCTGREAQKVGRKIRHQSMEPLAVTLWFLLRCCQYLV